MSGLELHERLRAMGRRPPTVFVTANPVKEAHACLVKPFPAESLIQAVHQSIAQGASQ
jgi:CheY-like chemotaxis protein